MVDYNFILFPHRKGKHPLLNNQTGKESFEVCGQDFAKFANFSDVLGSDIIPAVAETLRKALTEYAQACLTFIKYRDIHKRRTKRDFLTRDM